MAIGIVALLAVLGLNLAILWPYSFTFRLSAAVILEDHAETSVPTPTPALFAFLARAMESHHDSNERTLRRLNGLFQGASLALAVETIALLAAV